MTVNYDREYYEYLYKMSCCDCLKECSRIILYNICQTLCFFHYIVIYSGKNIYSIKTAKKYYFKKKVLMIFYLTHEHNRSYCVVYYRIVFDNAEQVAYVFSKHSQNSSEMMLF